MSTPSPERTLPVLLAKVARASDLSWYALDGLESDEGLLLRLAEGGHVDLVPVFEDGPVTAVLSEAGEALAATASFEDLTGPLETAPERASAALLLTVLVRGGEAVSYGSEHPYGRRGELAHVLSCGVDLAASTPVRDDAWEEATGTFTEPDRRVGVSGRVTCACGAVTRYPVYLETDSVVELVLAAVGAA